MKAEFNTPKDELQEIERKLRNLQQMIFNDALKRKEKVIAIDAETFEEIKGKEVRIKVSSVALQGIAEDLGENDE